jgi:cilia- and flagella-associated protein 251
VREWNADSKSCRRTTLGPCFGGPVSILLPLAPESPSNNDSDAKPFAAYACAEKVIGLCKMPFDGNPAKSMGIIAHPGPISALCSSGDAYNLATAGGPDCTVNLWSIHSEIVDQAIERSYQLNADESISPAVTTSVLPFVRMLEGGADGGELNDLVDFFYYSQLRTQGEDTTQPRDIRNAAPLSEVT